MPGYKLKVQEKSKACKKIKQFKCFLYDYKVENTPSPMLSHDQKKNKKSQLFPKKLKLLIGKPTDCKIKVRNTSVIKSVMKYKRHWKKNGSDMMVHS